MDKLLELWSGYSWQLLLAIIWALVWRGLALWRAARRGEKYWFIALLAFNTLGVLEILYLFIFSNDQLMNRAKHALRLAAKPDSTETH